jgi:hypothetical protein
MELLLTAEDAVEVGLAVELAELADCDVLESDMEAGRWGKCQ